MGAWAHICAVVFRSFVYLYLKTYVATSSKPHETDSTCLCSGCLVTIINRKTETHETTQKKNQCFFRRSVVHYYYQFHHILCNCLRCIATFFFRFSSNNNKKKHKERTTRKRDNREYFKLTMTEESNAWVFDSLIGFLHGPVWNAPLQTFIEEKSLIFDPNESSDENNEEYKKIYDEYKHLVDFMLGSFMEEMQITPEQFEVACLAGKHTASGLSFHQGLFQQIWAANDIRIFVRMMTQRNVELQLQALDVIERRHLNSTASSSMDDGDAEIAAGTSSANVSIDKPIPEQEQEEDLDDVIQEDVKKSVKQEFDEKNHSIDDAKPADKTAETDEQVANRMQRLNLYFENENRVDADEVKSRQEYLRAQRDKIVALKRRVRTEQLNANAERNGRPSSAQAAQRLLLSDAKLGDVPMVASLQLRKTLAKRLRNEVVDSKE